MVGRASRAAPRYDEALAQPRDSEAAGRNATAARSMVRSIDAGRGAGIVEGVADAAIAQPAVTLAAAALAQPAVAIATASVAEPALPWPSPPPPSPSPTPLSPR